jgi:hypothetical protein
LQSDQADADARMARARAEARRAEAIALQQEMKAKVAQSHAILVLAEAEIPAALAQAFRAGQLHAKGRAPRQQGRLRYPQFEFSTPDLFASPRRSRVDRVEPVDPIPKVLGEQA